jgi:hypothetical protein
MACRAEGDQILLRIAPGLTAELFVVNLEIRHRSARLASPRVAAEYLGAKIVAQLGIQAHTFGFWSELVQGAFSVA